MDGQILAWHKSNEASRRLASIPGVGPLTGSALVAAVGDVSRFRSERHFAAWLGGVRAILCLIPIDGWFAAVR